MKSKRRRKKFTNKKIYGFARRIETALLKRKAELEIELDRVNSGIELAQATQHIQVQSSMLSHKSNDIDTECTIQDMMHHEYTTG